MDLLTAKPEQQNKERLESRHEHDTARVVQKMYPIQQKILRKYERLLWKKHQQKAEIEQFSGSMARKHF